jgi:hypothetical protein
LAAQEDLNYDHRTTAFGARLMHGRIVGFGVCGFVRHLSGFWFGIKQTPDLCDPVSAYTVHEEASVADTMEARGQDMDKEPANELIRGQAHDLHPVSLFDTVVFPAEGHGTGIGADQTMI